MYNVLLENMHIHVYFELYMYSKLITLVRVLQMYVTVYKCIESERDQLLNIHCNIRIGTLSINFCVCT